MIGYYFDKDLDKHVLYIPGNLIVVEDNIGLDINYFPDNLKAFDKIWENDRTLIIGNIEHCRLRKINICEGLVRKFQDYCFKEEGIFAHIWAIGLFQLAKKEVLETEQKCQ